MKTVLVTGSSGVVGYGILRALRRSNLDLLLVGTSIYADSAAPAFCDRFVPAPRTDAPGYLEWLLEVVRRERVDLMIPGIELDVHFWNKLRAEILTSGCRAVLNASELIEICQDKWAFHERLRALGNPFRIDSSLSHDFADLAESFGLPFLIKPRRGDGSKGLHRVASAADFEPYVDRMGAEFLAQPIVGSDDDEYTTSAYGDGRGGVCALFTLRRRLSPGGYTEKAETREAPGIRDAVLELAREFKPLGPTNLQFRIHKSKPLLLEINPRFSSATSIRAALGFNEPAMAVRHFLEGELPCQPPTIAGRVVRYLEEAFLPA